MPTVVVVEALRGRKWGATWPPNARNGHRWGGRCGRSGVQARENFTGGRKRSVRVAGVAACPGKKGGTPRVCRPAFFWWGEFTPTPLCGLYPKGGARAGTVEVDRRQASTGTGAYLAIRVDRSRHSAEIRHAAAVSSYRA